jgi:glycosyltransferase involved in cell wall biosynthesis
VGATGSPIMADNIEKPIRVLHVLQRMEAGGSQAFLMNLYRNIDRSKIQFDFLVEYKQRQFYDDEIEKLGGRIFRSSFHEDYNPYRFKHFLKQFFANHPEYRVVHCHAYTIGAWVLRAAYEAGIPVRIAHSHNNNMTLEPLLPFKLIMRRRFPAYATELMAASTEAGNFLFGKLPFIVVRNAIDISSFCFDQTVRDQVRSELGFTDNDFVIGNVGRLEQQKNQKFLLDVFSELQKKQPNARLLMVGNGSLREELTVRATNLGIADRITLLSNRSDMDRLYQAMDVFVLPSLFEGLGIVAIEAQSAGLPTICSKGVAEDANVSPLFQRVPLEDGPSAWVRAIVDNVGVREPVLGPDGAKAHGFDVKDSSLKMQEWYLKEVADAR